MGTKRVLDEAELLKDDETQQQSDPIDMFNPPVSLFPVSMNIHTNRYAKPKTILLFLHYE